MAAYLITQAMGQQSQWVIKNLLEADVTIHAIVRNLDRIPARLDSRNIELFHAESKNFDDVFKAAQGCKAVFLNTFSFPGLEAVRAKTAIEACEKVGVMSIVAFTSILTRKKSISGVLVSSRALSRNCTSTNFRSTKLRVLLEGVGFNPTSFSDQSCFALTSISHRSTKNLLRLPKCGELDDPLTHDAKLPFIDVSDLGKYVGAAILDCARFGGQEIHPASELLDLEKFQGISEGVSGREVRLVRHLTMFRKTDLVCWTTSFGFFGRNDPKSLQAEAAEIPERVGIPFSIIEEALQRGESKVLECLQVEKAA